MKALALDYGSARTGVAVTDATGTIVRPLEVVARAAEPAGLARIAALVAEQGVDVVVIGMPVTLRGERGAQARETQAFAARLRDALPVPVEEFDERFTTVLAAQGGGQAPEDARAAAHLLIGWLEWKTARGS